MAEVLFRAKLTRDEPSQPWGISVTGGCDSGSPVIIQQIVPESAGAKCGLREGERIVRVDGKAAAGLSEEQLLAILRDANSTSLEVIVERSDSGTHSSSPHSDDDNESLPALSAPALQPSSTISRADRRQVRSAPSDGSSRSLTSSSSLRHAESDDGLNGTRFSHVSQKQLTLANGSSETTDPRYPWRKKTLRRSRSHEGSGTVGRGLLTHNSYQSDDEIMSSSFSGAFPSLEKRDESNSASGTSDKNSEVKSWYDDLDPFALNGTASGDESSSETTYVTSRQIERRANHVNRSCENLSGGVTMATGSSATSDGAGAAEPKRGGLRRCRSSTTLADGGARRVRFAEEPTVVSLEDVDIWLRPRSSRRTLMGLDKIHLPSNNSKTNASVNGNSNGGSMSNGMHSADKSNHHDDDDDAAVDNVSHVTPRRRRSSDTAVVDRFEFSGRTQEGSWRLVVQPTAGTSDHQPIVDDKKSDILTSSVLRGNNVNNTGNQATNFHVDINRLLQQQQYQQQPMRQRSQQIVSVAAPPIDVSMTTAVRPDPLQAAVKQNNDVNDPADSSSDYESLTTADAGGARVYNIRRAEQTRRRKTSQENSNENQESIGPSDSSGDRPENAAAEVHQSTVGNVRATNSSDQQKINPDVGGVAGVESNRNQLGLGAAGGSKNSSVSLQLVQHDGTSSVITSPKHASSTSSATTLHQQQSPLPDGSIQVQFTHLPRNVDFLIKQAHDSNRVYDSVYQQPQHQQNLLNRTSFDLIYPTSSSQGGWANVQQTYNQFQTQSAASKLRALSPPVAMGNIAAIRDLRSSQLTQVSAPRPYVGMENNFGTPLKDAWSSLTPDEYTTLPPNRGPLPFSKQHSLASVSSPPISRRTVGVVPSAVSVNLSSGNDRKPVTLSAVPTGTNGNTSIQIPVQHVYVHENTISPKSRVQNNADQGTFWNVNPTTSFSISGSNFSTEHKLQLSSPSSAYEIPPPPLNDSRMRGTSVNSFRSVATPLSSRRPPWSPTMDSDSSSDYSQLYFNQPLGVQATTSPPLVYRSSVGSVRQESPLFGMPTTGDSVIGNGGSRTSPVSRGGTVPPTARRTYSPQAAVGSPRMTSPLLQTTMQMQPVTEALNEADDELVQSRSFRMLQNSFLPGVPQTVARAKPFMPLSSDPQPMTSSVVELTSQPPVPRPPPDTSRYLPVVFIDTTIMEKLAQWQASDEDKLKNLSATYKLVRELDGDK